MCTMDGRSVNVATLQTRILVYIIARGACLTDITTNTTASILLRCPFTYTRYCPCTHVFGHQLGISLGPCLFAAGKKEFD